MILFLGFILFRFCVFLFLFFRVGGRGHSCYRHLIWDDRYIEDQIVSRLGWTQRHNETGVINGCQTLVL
ncbi:hypothetical protein HanXRQr2_Chr17g0808041 [Helianthus annuus]|uniref:Uncharacterized protein n=1 Tax=Helianthus annuus TaxID=4232 RepID=A0A9K3DID9_HELAN|nr:hypothetical protein HanXRQr2_Chr17g0808041 [Helianthus annuus]KAJ0813608.1 hypothetical protein HanPSC8_Chr17g0775521 [Helianthus annuus]